jgi:NAD(P)-dependent dehydrogenase (short-subunit alcohol dehydrogenase family)
MHFDDLNLDKSYTEFKAYVQSKLANVLFTKELSRKLKGDSQKRIKNNSTIY